VLLGVFDNTVIFILVYWRDMVVNVCLCSILRDS